MQNIARHIQRMFPRNKSYHLTRGTSRNLNGRPRDAKGEGVFAALCSVLQCLFDLTMQLFITLQFNELEARSSLLLTFHPPCFQ